MSELRASKSQKLLRIDVQSGFEGPATRRPFNPANVAASPLLCNPEQKQTIEITNQANVVDYLAEFVSKGRKRISEFDVLEIHRLTIEGLYPCAGKYRDALTRVKITDTKHEPSHPSQVKSDVRDMLEWLHGDGRDSTPIYRASFLLWRTNAIHPFNGGNGRVARALAYLVILKEVAPIFAGEPLPVKLRARKSEYIAGLKAADAGNLAPLEYLVLSCIQAQISEISSGPRN